MTTLSEAKREARTALTNLASAYIDLAKAQLENDNFDGAKSNIDAAADWKEHVDRLN